MSTHLRAVRASILGVLGLASLMTACGSDSDDAVGAQVAEAAAQTTVAPPRAASPTTTTSPAAATTTTQAPTTTTAGVESLGQFNLNVDGEQLSFEVSTCESSTDGLSVVAEGDSGDGAVDVSGPFLAPGTLNLDRRLVAGEQDTDPDAGAYVIVFHDGAGGYLEISLDGWNLTINDDLRSGSFVALGPDSASGDFTCF